MKNTMLCRDHRGVAEMRLDVSRDLHGTYTVTVRHRHYGGEWSYYVDSYVRLAGREVTELCDALAEQVGFRHPWLIAGEQGMLEL